MAAPLRHRRRLLGCLLLAVATRAAEDCAAAAAEGEVAAGEGDCGCSSLKRDAGEAPAAAEPAADHVSTAAADESGDGAPGRLLWIPGGEFVMGHNDASVSPSTFHVDGEGPARRVAVSGVWMGETEVSNAQWAAFAKATGFRSESERFGWSFVFERRGSTVKTPAPAPPRAAPGGSPGGSKGPGRSYMPLSAASAASKRAAASRAHLCPRPRWRSGTVAAHCTPQAADGRGQQDVDAVGAGGAVVDPRRRRELARA